MSRVRTPDLCSYGRSATAGGWDESLPDRLRLVITSHIPHLPSHMLYSLSIHCDATDASVSMTWLSVLPDAFGT
jgi:hypothetical protein